MLRQQKCIKTFKSMAKPRPIPRLIDIHFNCTLAASMTKVEEIHFLNVRITFHYVMSRIWSGVVDIKRYFSAANMHDSQLKLFQSC